MRAKGRALGRPETAAAGGGTAGGGRAAAEASEAAEKKEKKLNGRALMAQRKSASFQDKQPSRALMRPSTQVSHIPSYMKLQT